MPSQIRSSSRLRSSAAKKIQERFRSRTRLRSKASRKIQSRVRGKQTRKVINREKNTSTTVDDCPICLQPLTEEVRIALPCGHRFHKDCIRRSLTSTGGTCPKCRAVITNIPYPSIQQAQAQTQAQAQAQAQLEWLQQHMQHMQQHMQQQAQAQAILDSTIRRQRIEERIEEIDSIINRSRHGLTPRNATRIYSDELGPSTHFG